MKTLLTSALLALACASCTWVKPEGGGEAIRVSYGEDLSACTARGDVTASVKDRVGFFERSPMKVRDELETLARNQAARMDADTIQARDEPHNGEQHFGAYRCR